jgi:hypothetical protein
MIIIDIHEIHAKGSNLLVSYEISRNEKGSSEAGQGARGKA